MKRRFAAAAVGAGVPLDALETAAERSLQLGVRCAIDEARGLLLLDITGCAHLHATLVDLTGEKNLAEAWVKRLTPLCATVVVADGPRLAGVLAQTGSGLRVVPPGGARAALSDVPLTLFELDPAALQWFEALGLTTVGQVQQLPPGELERRWGHRARDAIALMQGADERPVTWYQPPEVLTASTSLDHGVEGLEPLLFLTKGLLDGLLRRLEARAQAVSLATLTVHFERRSNAPADAARELVFPTPMNDAKSMLSVLRLHLERFELLAPVVGVTLCFTRTVALQLRSLDLWAPSPKAARALPALLAELAAEVGAGCIGAPRVGNSHLASERGGLAPVGTPPEVPVSPWASLHGDTPEPLRIASAVPWVGPVVGQRLVRRQGVAWWHRGWSTAWDTTQMWDATAGTHAWVDARGSGGQAWHRGWVDG